MVSYYINDEHVRKEEFEQSLKDNLYKSIKKEYYSLLGKEKRNRRRI